MSYIVWIKVNDNTFDATHQIEWYHIDVLWLVRKKNQIIFVVFCDIVKFVADNFITQIDCVFISGLFSQIFIWIEYEKNIKLSHTIHNAMWDTV